MKLYAIITGDIVGSRHVESSIWLEVLQKALRRYGDAFEIYRGDSFQVEVSLDQCIEAIYYIKACLKCIPSLDVRLGLGIGEVEAIYDNITNSTGEAFIYSGKAFDDLNKDLFRVNTKFKDWDGMTNIMVGLTMDIAERWTVNMAQTVKSVIENPHVNQNELARILNRKYQSQVSTELHKSSWNKIQQVIVYCTQELKKRC